MVEQTRSALSRMTASPPPPMMMRQPSAGAAPSLTPKEILGIVRRHILLIVLCAFGGLVIGGGLWAYLLKYHPKYTASTYIAISSAMRTDPMQMTSPTPAKDMLYQTRLSKAMLIDSQNSFEKLLKNDEVRGTQWFQSFASVFDAMDDLKNHLGAAAQRDSDYVQVSMTCGSPKESALIVNKMVELFIKDQASGASSELLAQKGELSKQQSEVENDLKSAQASLEDLRQKAALGGVTMIAETQNSQYNSITTRLNSLTLDRSKLVADIQQLKASIGNLDTLAKGPVSVQVEHQVETDPIMLTLGERLSMLEGELARLLAKFGENHKTVLQTQDQIKQTREERNTRQAQIAEQTRQANWKDAQDQLVLLTSRLEQVDNDYKEAQAKQKDLDAMQAEYAVRAALRDERQKRLDEIKLQIEKINMLYTDPDAPKVRSVGLAPEPLKVSSPDAKVFFPGGFMLGLFLGIGLAFMMELLNDLIRTPTDINNYLHIPLLGMIPNVDEDDLIDGTDLYHVVRQAPYSIISESYRQMRTNLHLSGPAEATKVLLITSAAPSEGKTSTAVNLATTLAAEDKKVLLIDANFRRPTSMRTFPINTGVVYPGLSNLLTGQCGIKDAVRSTGVPNLDIIDCGPLPASPAEILGNSRMKLILEDLRKTYDNIILDGPPVLLVSDTKVLSGVVDAVMLVINTETTRRGMAIRMLRELRNINGAVIGCVLFNVKALKGGYFHEVFQSYREYQKVQLVHTI